MGEPKVIHHLGEFWFPYFCSINHLPTHNMPLENNWTLRESICPQFHRVFQIKVKITSIITNDILKLCHSPLSLNIASSSTCPHRSSPAPDRQPCKQEQGIRTLHQKSGNFSADNAEIVPEYAIINSCFKSKPVRFRQLNLVFHSPPPAKGRVTDLHPGASHLRPALPPTSRVASKSLLGLLASSLGKAAPLLSLPYIPYRKGHVFSFLASVLATQTIFSCRSNHCPLYVHTEK